MDEDKYFDIAAEELKALAHPRRLQILAYLDMRGECNVTALQEVMQLPQPTLSQHLARMQRGGMLSRRKKGTEVFYSINNNNIFDAIQQICNIDLRISSKNQRTSEK